MSEIITTDEPNYGPGNVLRSKRKEYEWSLEAVAEALNLSNSAMRSLEDDRYDQLPSATYVIGYWRSYARLLNIDIEETINANKRNLDIIAPESSGLNISNAYKHKTSNIKVGWLALLALLLGLGYFAWNQHFFGWFDVVIGTDEEQTQDSVTNSAQQTEISLAQAGGVESVLRPIENNDKKDIASDSKTMTENDQDSFTKVIIDENAEQAQGLVLQVATSQESTDVSNVVTDEKKPAPEDSELDNNITSAIVFTLSKDSWLDVRDKTNKRLVYETKTAGSEIKLAGKPPFYVYIGNPSGVKLNYKGKDVAFETHKSGLFSRFKLGDSIEYL